ncbi:hypothetical protein PCCS19_04500 [Paenibacillus sp. CCS19]|uniref:hypothetical protein n=1 Tax=Paenibacillus sp. CCS19 TaxID=3158387 RepID=UPI0025655ADC|nr:hypothetical protein [Paenibacillus cellulosilyticus]GMK37397.1 hypothetical protein PCCS19_04500 [Paenibacillus cellulosilyticus]
MRIKRKTASAAAICLLSAILLVGCDNGDSQTPSSSSNDSSVVNQDQQPAEQTPSNETADKDQIIKDYEALKTSKASISEVLAFFDQQLAKLSPEDADRLVRELAARYDEELPSRQDPFYKENVASVLNELEWPITSDSVDKIQDESVRTIVQAAFADGYKLEAVEGSIFPIVDYGSLRKFADALSPAYSAYIELLAQQSDQKAMSDGGLVISWDQFADRIIAYDQYASKFPTSPEVSKVKTMYEGAMTIYLNGADNTPIYDREGSYKLLDEVKSSYERIAKDYADTQTGKIVQGFVDVLKQSDWQVRSSNGKTAIQAVDSYREQALAEIKQP